jgi:site-specific recombinase XerD
LHKIQLTPPITQWPQAFREAMKREDLSPVTVRGYVSDLEMFIAWLKQSRATRSVRLN